VQSPRNSVNSSPTSKLATLETSSLLKTPPLKTQSPVDLTKEQSFGSEASFMIGDSISGIDESFVAAVSDTLDISSILDDEKDGSEKEKKAEHELKGIFKHVHIGKSEEKGIFHLIGRRLNWIFLPKRYKIMVLILYIDKKAAATRGTRNQTLI